MEPIFRKCLIAVEKITENTLPNLDQAYKGYTDLVKTKVISSEHLNEAKGITTSAIEALNHNQIDNKYIRNYLSVLENMHYQIEKKSKDLNELLEINRDDFVKSSKKFAEKNRDFLITLKHSHRPAEEILIEIVNFAKSIQAYINDDIPHFSQKIESFLKDTENEICNTVYDAYNQIQKLDPGTLPKLKTREWTYVEPSFFSRRAAFVDTDYSDGI